MSCVRTYTIIYIVLLLHCVLGYSGKGNIPNIIIYNIILHACRTDTTDL